MDWVHQLPVGWLIGVVVAGTSLVAAGVYAVVTRIVGQRAQAFKALSPGLPPSMALVFGTHRRVRRGRALDRAQRRANRVPASLAAALRVALAIEPRGERQVTAQRELVSSLQDALDARRPLIILSGSTVNWLRWTGVIALAVLTLVAIGLAHSENRLTTATALGLFATAVAVTLVMIAAQDRPFSGEFGISPTSSCRRSRENARAGAGRACRRRGPTGYAQAYAAHPERQDEPAGGGRAVSARCGAGIVLAARRRSGRGSPR